MNKKVLNMKSPTPDVQDFFCLKIYKNRIKIPLNLSVFAI